MIEFNQSVATNKAFSRDMASNCFLSCCAVCTPFLPHWIKVMWSEYTLIHTNEEILSPHTDLTETQEIFCLKEHYSIQKPTLLYCI